MPRKKIYNKKVRNATPIKVDGITFRSKLEAYCYKQLKANKVKFSYEKDKFILIPAFEFKPESWQMGISNNEKVFKQTNHKIRAISYTPDFTNLKDGWIIECKGNPNESFPMRWKLFKKYLADNKLNYDLFLPRNKKQIDETINIIKNGSNKTRF